MRRGAGVQLTDDEIKKIWRRKKVQVEMIQDRLYLSDVEEMNVLNKYEVFLSLFKKLKRFKDQSTFLSRIYKNTEGIKLNVLYHMTKVKKEGAKGIANVISLIKEDAESKNPSSKYIIISNAVIAPFYIGDLMYPIEIFQIDFFAFNPNKHYLTQKHTFMNPSENSAFLERTGLKSNELGAIGKSSPIVRYFGQQSNVGGLVWITRDPILPSHVPEMYYVRQIRDIQAVDIPDDPEVLESEVGPDEEIGEDIAEMPVEPGEPGEESLFEESLFEE